MIANPYQNTDVIRAALELKRVAIVGLSAKAFRDSNAVGRYMLDHGYQVIPVNPMEREIFGLQCYPSLADVPGSVDVVNVFRVPEAVPDIAREALGKRAKCLWLQLGVISEEGAKIAADGGMDVVMDRCIKVEHARHLD